MKSPIEIIMDSTIYSDTEKKTRLYNSIKTILSYLISIRTTMANETTKLNELMDANANNSDEHHAKTMVFYGRKVAIRDLCLGVVAQDQSHTMPPYVGTFVGLDQLLRENDFGRVTIRWNCKTGMNNIWKTGQEPSTEYLDQKHMLGSKVTMPTICNLDNDGIGTGTNTYKIKSGYIINGWRFATTQYMYADDGNDYVYKVDAKTGTKSRVQDRRIFAFSSTAYQLPYNLSILPSGTLTFVLNYIAIWYNIEFVVRHGSIANAAPCKNPIKTRLGNTITLPLTTLITMDAGYEIDKTSCPYGTWTTVDPNTGSTPPDPDGDPIADMDFNADSSFVIGTDMDAGIRRLFLKIKTV